jgi:endonuclease-3 related protein
MTAARRRKMFLEMFARLSERYGPQHWWPGDTPFEVMVGAVLTQNTNWTNVARAIENLKDAGALSLERMRVLAPGELAMLIRPAGYYNLKAQRLGNLLDFLARECGGDLDALWRRPLERLRGELLAIKGVGPETADSILLYAGGLPTFVIDAYTVRVLGRHGLLPADADYHGLRELFMTALPPDAPLYNEYHALLVALGKERCKKGSPLCEGCPLEGF